MSRDVRTIGVVTGSRADYGCYLPVLRQIQATPQLRLHLMVTGMHLSPDFGLTVRTIEADGFPIGERVEMLTASDAPEGIAASMSRGVVGFAQAYARQRPDLVLVLGDRFEMYAAALAAVPFNIPLAHIHGGELTQGAMDDCLRHSLTKLSHLHFVATEEAARRVMQMGEEAWRVCISGAPSLDNLRSIQFLKPAELTARFGIRFDAPPLLVTFHPVTLEYEQTAWQVEELLGALQECRLPVVFTAPNADTNGRLIACRIEEFLQHYRPGWLIANLWTQAYWSLMRQAAAMVGNSSSGLIEAPSFGVPVVNIGTRQQGRLRAANVIDAGYDRGEILEGIRRALEPSFRASLRGVVNPYGDGHAAATIVERLKDISLDQRLIAKRFGDIELASPLSTTRAS